MSDHLIDEIADDLNAQRRKELGLPPEQGRRGPVNLMLEELLIVLTICAVPSLIVLSIRYFFG